MKTYTLMGSTQQPGVAGDWHPLLHVQAKDFESAARKLRAKVRDENGDDGRWLHPGRLTVGIVARALVARKNLRGKKRRQELRDEIGRLERRYSYYRIRLLPRIP